MKNWESLMSAEEIANVNIIISKIQREPRPSVNEFMDVVARACEDAMITYPELSIEAS